MIPLRVLMDVEKNPICEKDDVDAYPGKLLDLVAVGVLTKGTTEGNPTVAIKLVDPDGKIILAQTTLRLFHMAAKAFEARYGEFLK